MFSFPSAVTYTPLHISYLGGHPLFCISSKQSPRINTMRFHSLIAILAAAVSTVVAEPIRPRLAHPPQSNSTLTSNVRSKSTENPPLLLVPVEEKPELLVREGQGSVPYWLEEIQHQGISAFHPDKNSYQVFRNVKDFGAKGTS
jgi:hypothetical protein